ncbi:MAG TPA: hypothetical protein VKA50_06405 [Gammaproteobacteria bacterium]|nr:hypothetical protein [Gammaproteobacteria bacterium]
MLHSLYIHIEEDQTEASVEAIKGALFQLPHVTNVEMRLDLPHEVLVEFEPHYGVPMNILTVLGKCGLRPDVMSA